MTNISQFPTRRREPEPDELARAHMTNARLHRHLEDCAAQLTHARDQRDGYRVGFWMTAALLALALVAGATLALSDADAVAIKRDVWGSFLAWGHGG